MSAPQSSCRQTTSARPRPQPPQARCCSHGTRRQSPRTATPSSSTGHALLRAARGAAGTESPTGRTRTQTRTTNRATTSPGSRPAQRTTSSCASTGTPPTATPPPSAQAQPQHLQYPRRTTSARNPEQHQAALTSHGTWWKAQTTTDTDTSSRLQEATRQQVRAHGRPSRTRTPTARLTTRTRSRSPA